MLIFQMSVRSLGVRNLTLLSLTWLEELDVDGGWETRGEGARSRSRLSRSAGINGSWRGGCGGGPEAGCSRRRAGESAAWALDWFGAGKDVLVGECFRSWSNALTRMRLDDWYILNMNSRKIHVM